MKVIIIGGVAGGPSLATRLRRLDETVEILLLERGAHISYASCALPYYLGDVVTDFDRLIERTPALMQEKNNIEVRVQHEMTAIDATTKTITVTDLTTQTTYQEQYDVLVLATGSRAVLPAIKGLAAATNCFTLRNLEDAATIKQFLVQQQPQTATVVGAGVAGLEIAENLHARGIAVTVVDQLPTVAAPYDAELAALIAEELTSYGITLQLGQTITAIEAAGRQLLLANGTRLDTELVIFATGVRPNSEVAAAAGIKLAADHHIIVDEKLATNLPAIYAIGDVIETKSYITGLATPSMLSSAANRQGHLLADILSGKALTYPGFIGSGVAKIFNLTASFVGYTEQALQAAGITNYQTIFITPFDHAAFYPGAQRLNLKLLFDDQSGKLLGGQAVGLRGVDKRIGELSVAISGRLTVFDLPALELPYSPPYSTTRDPLNTAGYVAINQLQRAVVTVDLAAIPVAERKTAYFLDISEAGQPASGSVLATHHIPLSALRARLNELPTEQPIYITFRKGAGPYNAARLLAGNGFNVQVLAE
ncbi:FAD-dependent oxidoreductase [Loigolactobacillus binensis]|uniref:FAD-dependent oxidoreductase n=1 Tax=Loigolactobacillus binensis TaxID=2559922 RepID=A0ABW3E8S6_9LACO|nr:FAD-dependent oxidoreductase [Loigolactobacillus binensis]